MRAMLSVSAALRRRPLCRWTAAAIASRLCYARRSAAPTAAAARTAASYCRGLSTAAAAAAAVGGTTPASSFGAPLPGPSAAEYHAGTLPATAHGLFDSLTPLQAKYGGVFRVWMGARDKPVPCVVVSDPEATKRVLVDNVMNYRKGMDYVFARALLGNGLLTSEMSDEPATCPAGYDPVNHSVWKRARRAILPSFGPVHMHALVPLVTAAVHRQLSGRLKAGVGTGAADKPLNLLTFASDVYIDAVAQKLLGATTADMAPVPGLARMTAGTGDLGLALERSVRGMQTQFDAYAAGVAPREHPINVMRQSCTFVRSQLRAVVDFHCDKHDKQQQQQQAAAAAAAAATATPPPPAADAGAAVPRRRAGTGGGGRTPAAERTLIGALVGANDPVAGPLSRDQIVDECATVLLAGQDAASAAIAWLGLVFAQSPDVQTRLQAEFDTVLGPVPAGSTTDTFGYAELQDCTYLNAVVRELLRLWAPAPGYGRMAVRDDTLNGLHVPAGAFVLIAPYLTHRLPAIYGADPLKFDPSRFASRSAFDKHQYAPFGFGPRSCVGQAAALVEIKALVAALLRRYTIVPVDARKLVREYREDYVGLVFRPQCGVDVHLVPRTAATAAV